MPRSLPTFNFDALVSVKALGARKSWAPKPEVIVYFVLYYPPFGKKMTGFNASCWQRPPGSRERFVSSGQPHSFLRNGVVLLNHVIQIFALPKATSAPEATFGFQLVHSLRICRFLSTLMTRGFVAVLRTLNSDGRGNKSSGRHGSPNLRLRFEME